MQDEIDKFHWDFVDFLNVGIALCLALLAIEEIFSPDGVGTKPSLAAFAAYSVASMFAIFAVHRRSRSPKRHDVVTEAMPIIVLAIALLLSGTQDIWVWLLLGAGIIGAVVVHRLGIDASS